MGELRGGQKSPEEEDGDLKLPRNVANDEELLTAQDVRWIYERRGLLKKRDKGDGPQHFHELIKDCQMVRNLSHCILTSKQTKFIVIFYM